MYGARPPLRPPFGPRFAKDLFGNGAPTLNERDFQQLWAEGLLPPEFYEGSEGDGLDLSELGQPAERILRTDFDLGKNLPETGQDIVAKRGPVGDTFRELEPLNLGRGAGVSAGDSNVTILRAPGLDCLTPVGVMLGYNIQGPITDTTDLFVQATIKWGVGGEQHEATVDVGRGTQIRLASASFIEVLYHYLPDDTTTPPRTGPDIMGIALLGYGTPSFRPSPARFTQRMAIVSPGTNSNPV